ncbi:MAG: DUF2157 domain-containing protein [Intrasporangiaceae bacterium]|nr:DUF2157 domain-containing protein [Intrasporangiaceae bacterium]
MSTTAPKREPLPLSADNHRWLTTELREWEREGLISSDTAGAITDRYTVSDSPAHRITAVRVILGLGASFLGIGLIWLVAANLDQLSPLLRFVVVTVLWIGLAVAAELTRDLVSAALKLLSALAFGAVVFQAAQSLQVPAYRPVLLLAWGLGALLYAYARTSRAAGFVGITVLAAWYVWQAMDAAGGVVTFTGAILLLSVAAVAIAALHPPEWRAFGRLWLALGAIMSLVGLFTAALPQATGENLWSGGLTAGLILVIGLAAAALWRSGRDEQVELAIAGAGLLFGVVFSLWRPISSGSGMLPSDFTALMWVRTGLAIVAFLLVAGAWAIVGARRQLAMISAAAVVAVVIFTTFQSFAVFAPIISGATLFLAVGAVMILTGIVAERARRRIGSEVASS